MAHGTDLPPCRPIAGLRRPATVCDTMTTPESPPSESSPSASPPPPESGDLDAADFSPWRHPLQAAEPGFAFVLGWLAGTFVQSLTIAFLVSYTHRIVPPTLVLLAVIGLTMAWALIQASRRRARALAAGQRGSDSEVAALLGLALSGLMMGVCAGMTSP